MLKFSVSDDPAPKLEVCRNFPLMTLSPDEPPPPPFVGMKMVALYLLWWRCGLDDNN